MNKDNDDALRAAIDQEAHAFAMRLMFDGGWCRDCLSRHRSDEPCRLGAELDEYYGRRITR